MCRFSKTRIRRSIALRSSVERVREIGRPRAFAGRSEECGFDRRKGRLGGQNPIPTCTACIGPCSVKKLFLVGMGFKSVVARPPVRVRLVAPGVS